MRSDTAVGRSPGRSERPSDLAVVVVNLTAVTGVLVASAIGRPRFLGMTLVFASAVAIVDALILPVRETVRARDPGVWAVLTDRVDRYEPARAVPILTDRRTILTTLAASVAVVTLVGRGLAYFLVVTVFFSLAICRVAIRGKTDGWPKELGTFVLGTASVTAAQILTVAYYARTFDTIFHTTVAGRIAAFQSLAVVQETRYDDLLLSHTYMGLGMELTGLSPRTYTAITVIALYAASLVTLFALFRNVTDSVRVSLLGVGLLAVNPTLFRWATQTHAQGVNFLLFLTFLLLVSKWRPDVRVTGLVAVVAVAMVTTHHLSTAMAVVLGGIPVALVGGWNLFVGVSITVRPLVIRYTLVVVTGVIYWTQTGITNAIFVWLFATSPASEGLPTKQFIVQRYTDPIALIDATVPFLLDQAHYVVFVAFAGYVLAEIYRRGRRVDRSVLFVAVLFLAAVTLYVPNPVWVPLRGWAAINRWGIMTLPFLLLPAVGLNLLAKRARGQGGSAVIAVLVIVLVFTSVGGAFSDPSLPDVAGEERGAQRYFSAGDVAAAEFAVEKRAGQSVYGPTLFPGYLQCSTWDGPGDDERRGFASMTVQNGEIQTNSGLTIMPERAFVENGIKVRVVNPAAYEQNVTVFAPVFDETIAWTTADRSVVYDNGETVIVYEPPGDENPEGERCE